MQNQRQILLIAAFSAIFLLFIVFFNNSIMGLRIMQLKYHLMKNSYNKSALNHFGLVTAYENNKKLYFKKITSLEYDENMLKLMENSKVFSDSHYNFNLPQSNTDQISLFFINLIRMLMNKNPVENIVQTEYHKYLYTAYYYEQNHEYKSAIQTYALALSENKDIALKAGILLHQGYSYAMLSFYEKAIDKYDEIIKKYPNTEIAVTASILKKFLFGFKKEKENLLRDNKYSIDKTEKLIHLFAYENAWSMLKEIEKKSGVNKDVIDFYKARLFEKSGKKEKAVNKYLEVILENPKSTLARASNKNLYLMGSRLGDQELIKTSVKINKTIKDKKLDLLIKSNTLEPLKKPKNIKENPLILDLKKIEQIETKEEEEEEEERKKIKKNTGHESKNRILSKKPNDSTANKITVITKNEDYIIGFIISEDSKQIVLNTSLGKITIQKSNIKNINRQK
ncbi:MAG: hypothetical protein OEZ13_02955 [Spirochaetia bacterium]|nr:hypothetical protein [Spirochaetia bacterium]